MKICRHCDNRAVVKGMCKTHYNRAYRRVIPTTGWRTAVIDGKEMSVRQMVRYVKENRDYTLTRHTISRRMNRGLTGEDLIGPPVGQTGWKKWPQKVVPVAQAGWGFRVTTGGES